MINVGDKFKVTQEYIDWYKVRFPLVPEFIGEGEIVTVVDTGDGLVNFRSSMYGFHLHDSEVNLLERINE